MSSDESLRGIRVVTERSGNSEIQSASIVAIYAGSCSRIQSSTPQSAYSIERRDLRKRYQVQENERTYRVIPLLELATPEEREQFIRSGRHWLKRRGRLDAVASGKYRIHLRYERTSDAAKMHGCLARRWIITRRDEREQQGNFDCSEVRTEAWYVEAEELAKRYPPFDKRLIHEALLHVTSGNERPVIEKVGDRPSGLCVESTSTTLSRLQAPGHEMQEMRLVRRSRVTGLTEDVFAASMFEPPDGFSRVPVYPSRYSMGKRELNRKLGGLVGSITEFLRTH